MAHTIHIPYPIHQRISSVPPSKYTQNMIIPLSSANLTFCCITISSNFFISALYCQRAGYLTIYLTLWRNICIQFSSTQWYNFLWCFVFAVLFHFLKHSIVLSILCQFLFYYPSLNDLTYQVSAVCRRFQLWKMGQSSLPCFTMQKLYPLQAER